MKFPLLSSEGKRLSCSCPRKAPGRSNHEFMSSTSSTVNIEEKKLT